MLIYLLLFISLHIFDHNSPPLRSTVASTMPPWLVLDSTESLRTCRTLASPIPRLPMRTITTAWRLWQRGMSRPAMSSMSDSLIRRTDRSRLSSAARNCSRTTASSACAPSARPPIKEQVDKAAIIFTSIHQSGNEEVEEGRTYLAAAGRVTFPNLQQHRRVRVGKGYTHFFIKIPILPKRA